MRIHAGVLGLLLLAAAHPACGTWNGNVAASISESRIDTTTVRSVDHQYQLFATGSLFPAVDYSGGIRFRNTQSKTADNPVYWRNEFEPNLLTNWVMPLLRLSGNARYRQARTRERTNELTGQSYGLAARSRAEDLPHLYGQWQWDHNVNDLELLGLDTKQQRLSAGADYTLKTLYLRYNYSDIETRNSNTGLEHISLRHSARADYALRLFHNRIAIQPSYQGTFRDERERQTGNSQILIPIPPLTALYAVDPVPDYDSLRARPTLNDGDQTTPAGADLDLSLDLYHNFGLDFGAPVRVDHLYLSTDTLANEFLSWAIFTSSDNLNWQRIADYRPYPFNRSFLRYEIIFPVETTRYIKIVMQPQPQSQSVRVAELRALSEQSGDVTSRRPSDHRGTLDIRIQPARWLNLYATGFLLETGQSTTTQDRRQRDLNTGLSMPIAGLVNLTAFYQASTVRYSQPVQSGTDNDHIGAGWEAAWLSTLTTRVSASHAQEWISQRKTRMMDALSAQLRAIVFPQLRSTTDFSYSEDHRYSAGDRFLSRGVRQLFDSRPTHWSSLNVEYRWDRVASRLNPIPTARENVNVQSSVDLTSQLAVRGDLTYSRESSIIYRAWSGTAIWTATNTLSFSSTYNRTNPSSEGGNELLSVDASFRPQNAMEWQFGFSRGRFENNSELNNTNLRIGLNLRI